MPLYTLTEQQKDAMRTRAALQRAQDNKLPEILTQAEAHKRFPDRGYDGYDKCMVICGTKKSIKKNVQVTHALKINTVQGEQFIHTDGDEGLNPDCCVDDGFSIDVEKRNDVRIVVWIK